MFNIFDCLLNIFFVFDFVLDILDLFLNRIYENIGFLRVYFLLGDDRLKSK